MIKRLKLIYNNSPIWFQNIMISVYGLNLYLLRYNKAYHKAFKEYITKDYTNKINESEIQNSELRKIIKYAVAHSKFYKRFYKNIKIENIQTVDDLKILPILEKEVLRSNIEDVYTIDKSKGISSFTGGTTGKSLEVLFTKDDVQKRSAYLDAFKWKLGIDTFKTKKATFSGREITQCQTSKQKNIYWRYNWFYKQKLYSTFDLKEEYMPFYIYDLNKYKPEVLNGFVSALYEIAKYIDRNDIKLEFIPKAIFTTSETLLPIHRELIEKVFRTKISNQYASAEGAPFITECKYGNLHYNTDTGVIEILATEHGDEMLVTSFTSYGTPLIRYKIGDKIKFKRGTCHCGSCHPLVENIEGRQVDYLYSTERGKISLSHLADVIKGMPNSVKNMQYIQNEIDVININIVVDAMFTEEHKAKISEALTFRFGPNTKFNINKVDEIPRESSGKYSLIKNNIIKTLT